MSANPQQGDFVRVRTRLYLVDQVDEPTERAPREETVVHLSCLDEDAQGARLSVLWQSEVDAEVVDATSFRAVAARGLDEPRTFAAYLHAQLAAALAFTDRAEERVEVFHGEIAADERREAIKNAFNGDPAEHPVRVLIATDAAREGVNLQSHCADLFHFDVPWNPSRMEQRNGRIDRKLQREEVVNCHYFVFAQREEDRVLEVRQAKLCPVVFEVVHLHLEHRIVQRLLGRFRAQGFLHHQMSRASAVLVEEAEPKVILLGRLALFGGHACRLHEEILLAAAPWVAPAMRKGKLRALGQDHHESVALTTLSPRTSRRPPSATCKSSCPSSGSASRRRASAPRRSSASAPTRSRPTSARCSRHPEAPRDASARAVVQRAREAPASRGARLLGQAPRHHRRRDGVGAQAYRAGVRGASATARPAGALTRRQKGCGWP